MAQLPGTFDANSVPPSDRNFDVMRTGWQNAQAIDSDFVPTKDGRGQRATFTFEILDGDYKGRQAWASINVINPSTQAQAIGQRELADLALAVGVPQITDTKQAEFKPLQIKLGVDKDDKDRNVIRGYRPYGGVRTDSNGHAPAPASPAQPAASGFGSGLGQMTSQQQAQPPSGGAPWPKRA